MRQLLRLLWSCAALAVCALSTAAAPIAAQGTTGCDSPCKVTHLPLVGPRGAVCDSPCKLQHLPLVRHNEQAVPVSNSLCELVGSPGNANAGYSVREVDKPAKLTGTDAWPAYPDSLKASHIGGQVMMTFIVDTTGLVESNSLHIVKSTHPLFSQSVRDWVPKLRFVPAEKGGVKVKQFVCQWRMF
ncbi:MAG: TonB family protein [Gemmatimonadaceae bacterium]